MHSRRAAFVWPLFQDYAYLDLTPISIDIPLQGALSRENIRIAAPSTFTVGISTNIDHESAYIKALGQKAASEAINQARIDVAEQERKGQTGVAEAEKEKSIAISIAGKEQRIGVAAAEPEKQRMIIASEAQIEQRRRVPSDDGGPSACDDGDSGEGHLELQDRQGHGLGRGRQGR